MERYHIGCSGWSYRDWVGRFYPQGTPADGMLELYAQRFGTVEIDMTFYRVPGAATAERWAERTPDDFVFAAKMNRAVTHYKKLQGTDRAVGSFFRPLERLGEKLGPVLVQLPPSLSPDHELLDGFLRSLPARHRYAVEFRHPGWLTSRTYRVLEEQGVALCLADRARERPELVVTAPFAYVRWHGRSASYSYTTEELREWAGLLGSLDVDGVYGYFNNDAGARAPSNAAALSGMLAGRGTIP